MKILQNHLYAVVTGDVVASSRLGEARRRELHGAMVETSGALREAFAGALLGEVDLFGGDGWQMVLSEPALALRAALYFRAGLRARMGSGAPDTRAAVAVGTIDFVPGRRVSQGDGEAFRLSGRALRAMGRGGGIAFRLGGGRDGTPSAAPGDEGPALEKTLDVVVRLVDALAARWSDRQALAVTGALRGWAQERIARECWPRPVTQQAVQQHLDRAAWGSVEAALAFFEETIGRAVDGR